LLLLPVYGGHWLGKSPGLAGFVYSEFSCVQAAATSFPLSKHTGGGDTAPAFSGLRVCIQLTWEVGLPPSPVEFSSLRQSHKLSHSWLLGAHPRSCRSLFGLPGLFIYCSRKDSLPPIFSAQGAPPSFPRVFIVLIAYYSVSLIFSGGSQSVQGAMLLWPRVVCGSTTVPLSSPCLRLPKPSGCGPKKQINCCYIFMKIKL
jgi:hypothetical protein